MPTTIRRDLQDRVPGWNVSQHHPKDIRKGVLFRELRALAGMVPETSTRIGFHAQEARRPRR